MNSHRYNKSGKLKAGYGFSKQGEVVSIDFPMFHRDFFCVPAKKEGGGLGKRAKDFLESFKSHDDIIEMALKENKESGDYWSETDFIDTIDTIFRRHTTSFEPDIDYVWRSGWEFNYSWAVARMFMDRNLHPIHGAYKGRIIRHKLPDKKWPIKPTDRICNLYKWRKHCFICGKRLYKYYREPSKHVENVLTFTGDNNRRQRITVCKDELCQDILDNAAPSYRYNHRENIVSDDCFKLLKVSMLADYLNKIRPIEEWRKKGRYTNEWRD